jgi:hypothetical protein
MSEKYSTDDLISVVGNYTTGRVGVITYAECDAIIARLRAGDAIVKEATRVGDYLCLWDDHEFDALREMLEKYEGD